jgi:hypothetical protein
MIVADEGGPLGALWRGRRLRGWRRPGLGPRHRLERAEKGEGVMPSEADTDPEGSRKLRNWAAALTALETACRAEGIEPSIGGWIDDLYRVSDAADNLEELDLVKVLRWLDSMQDMIKKGMRFTD